MKFNKFLVILLVIVWAISIVGCSDTSNAAPVPDPKPAPAPEPVAEPAPKPAPDPDKKIADLLKLAQPNLERLVSEGVISQVFMDDKLAKIASGELNMEQLMDVMVKYR